MAVLYRKYRPQAFAEVVNQKPIVQTLKNQVKNGKPAHAYLFTGSRGVGKTSIARILAKAVNCPHAKGGEPCGKCSVCEQVTQGNFLDLVEIDAASNTGVDNIRDLIEHVKFSPSAGKYKVFIIDEVHMLSKGAFNALLKTLEEPPQHAIFVLATTEINKVPATIVSRTQRFDFKALSIQDLRQHLEYIAKQEKLDLDKEVLGLVAQHADGSVRDALSLLGKVSTLGAGATAEDCRQLLGITDAAMCQELLELIVSGSAEPLPAFFAKLAGHGLDFAVFNRDFLEYLSKVLVYKVTADEGASGLDESRLSAIKILTAQLGIYDLIFITRLFLRSFKELGSSPDQQIPLLLASLEAALKKASAGQPAPKPQAGNPAKAAFVYVAAKNTVAEERRETAPKSSAAASAESAMVIEEVPDFEYETVASAEEIKQAWPGVIEAVKAINGPLANLIRTSPVQRIERGRIVLGVKYLFHKQNIEQQKNASLICKSIEQVSGKKLGIAAEVAKEIKTVQAAGESLGEALAIFGGEVVE